MPYSFPWEEAVVIDTRIGFAAAATVVLLAAGCLSEQEKARRTLDVEGVDFTADAFVTQLGEGNTRTAELFLTAGMAIDTSLESGETALHVATMNGEVEGITWLLDRGASLEAVDGKGRTPLWAPALSADVDTVTLLIEREAVVDARDGKQRTPLMMAAANDHVDVARLLLEAGADVNASTSIGVTPLMNASVTGSEAMLRLLLDSGADPTAQDSAGKTAADIARSFEREANAVLLEGDAGDAPTPP